MKSNNKLSGLVDELGILKAQIAALTEKENKIKQQLVETGLPVVEGQYFRATISDCEKEVKDEIFKALIDKLIADNTSPQFRRAHTNEVVTHPVRVVAKVRAS